MSNKRVLLLAGDFVEDFVEQAVGNFHDVVFGHAGDFFTAICAGIFKGIATDALTARAGDDFQARHHVLVHVQTDL